MKLDKTRLVFGLYLLVVIAAFELVTGYFHLPAWPAVIAMILFFIEDMDARKAPHILAGGVLGIALILLARPIIGAVVPLFGLELARLVFILGLVFAIIAFGEMAPMVVNNYAFLYLVVTGIAVQQPNPNPLLWMAMTAIGGALLIGAVVGIGKIMVARAAARQPSASTLSI